MKTLVRTFLPSLALFCMSILSANAQQQVAALHGIGQILGSTTQFEEALNAILKLMCDQLDMSLGTVSLLSQDFDIATIGEKWELDMKLRLNGCRPIRETAVPTKHHNQKKKKPTHLSPHAEQHSLLPVSMLTEPMTICTSQQP